MIPVPHQALLGIHEKFDGHCDPTVGLLLLRPMDLPKPGFGPSVCGLYRQATPSAWLALFGRDENIPVAALKTTCCSSIEMSKSAKSVANISWGQVDRRVRLHSGILLISSSIRMAVISV